MPDDRFNGDGEMTRPVDPRDRRRGNRTVAESMGIPPAIGRRPRPEPEESEHPEGGTRVPVERRKRDAGHGGEADLRRQLEAAEEAVEKARAEAAENEDKYVRTVAEMDNLRKRFRQEQANQLQYGNSELLAKLLPVVDNFYRALEHAPDAAEGEAPLEWVTGLTMVLRQLEEMLAAAGVTTIEAVGHPFDPNLHQAVLAEPSEEHGEGTVIDELQRGYMLHDRVLRPSMVKVAGNS
ncbi:MAG TPA: nucleotide exchange factor GrpE [Candidatus Dormibacteraeota bacterium]|jgi:molecular chaperone GrpE|nr:nucleotide exchange factor GrpE [Candidatus Dormibacteraeota bacterium]